MNHCSQCGVTLAASNLFCPRCGHPVGDAPPIGAPTAMDAASLDALDADLTEGGDDLPDTLAYPGDDEDEAFLSEPDQQASLGDEDLSPDLNVDLDGDGFSDAEQPTTTQGTPGRERVATQISMVVGDGGVQVGQIGRDFNLYGPEATVACPICRRHRTETETFACESCGRSVCLSHRDTFQHNVCTDCTRPRELSIRFGARADATDSYPVILASEDLGVEPWEHESWLSLPFELPDANLSSLLGYENADEEPDPLREQGEQLFRASFPETSWDAGEIENPFLSHVHRWSGLQVRIVEPPGALAYAPWECLHDGTTFLNLSTHVSVVRWIEKNGPAFLGQGQKPLEVLVVANNRRSVVSASQTEAEALSEALGNTVDEGLIRFTPIGSLRQRVADGADAKMLLRDSLLTGHYHILHLAGEFDVDEALGRDQVAIHLDNGNLLPLDALSLWLQDSAVQVVILGAALTRGGDFVSPISTDLGLAERLLQGSVAALVINRAPLTAEKTRDFAAAFYDPLARDRPLERSLTIARLSLRETELYADSQAWSVPILYQRPYEGALLDLLPTEQEQIEAALPAAYARFVEEDLAALDPQEAPNCRDEVLTHLETCRLQVIIGNPDTEPLVLSRHLAHRLQDAAHSRQVLRFPRYEDAADFLPSTREISDAVVLYDTDRLSVVGKEIEALVQLVDRHPSLTVLISSSDEAACAPETTLGDWLIQHPDQCIRLGPAHYQARDDVILKSILSRVLRDASKAGLLDPAIAADVLDGADQLFHGDVRLQLPGEIRRFVYHYLVHDHEPWQERDVRILLRAMDNTGYELGRWFIEALSPSQRVLAMTFALFQGVPTYLLAFLYRMIVDQLRDVFHLDIAALPLRAELQQWPLYFTEVQKRGQVSQQEVYVEFSSDSHRNELLLLLRENYQEWLLEIVPSLGSVVCANTQADTVGWNDEEYRLVRYAIARALAEIARCSPRALSCVETDMVRWMQAEWPNIDHDPNRSILQNGHARQILSIGGRVFQHILASTDNYGAMILNILSNWWSSESHKVRWAAVSAYGRVAAELPARRLVQRLVTVGHDAQSRRAMSGDHLERAKRSRRDSSTIAEAEQQLKSAEEICRAVAYALRGFPVAAFSQLRRLYELLAGDQDMGVRVNTAIALDRVSLAAPDKVCALLARWACEANWWRWWTAVATSSFMIENDHVDDEQALVLIDQLLDTPRIIDEQRKRASSPNQIGREIAWAMQSCLGHVRDLLCRQRQLTRTLGLWGSMVGRDFRYDAILGAAFEAIVVSGDRHALQATEAMFSVARDWVTAQEYESSRARRRMAVELYLAAGRTQWKETIHLLRKLAEFEAYDYRRLKGRAYETLPLSHIGLGGIILQIVRESDGAALDSILPLMREMAMIKDPQVRSVGAFVVAGLATERNQSQIVRTLRGWARGPQIPLQLGAVDAVLEIARNPDLADSALDVLGTLTANPHPQVVEYLNDRLPEIMELNLVIGRELVAALDERTEQQPLPTT